MLTLKDQALKEEEDWKICTSSSFS